MRKHLSLIIGSIMVGSLLFSLVIGLASSSSAEEVMPDPVIFAQKAITSNQKFITDNRPIVDEFNRRKDNNAVQTGILQAYGYKYDWATGEVVKDENLESR